MIRCFRIWDSHIQLLGMSKNKPLLGIVSAFNGINVTGDMVRSLICILAATTLRTRMLIPLALRLWYSNRSSHGSLSNVNAYGAALNYATRG